MAITRNHVDVLNILLQTLSLTMVQRLELFFSVHLSLIHHRVIVMINYYYYLHYMLHMHEYAFINFCIDNSLKFIIIVIAIIIITQGHCHKKFQGFSINFGCVFMHFSRDVEINTYWID